MTNEKVFPWVFTEGSANVFSIIFIFFICASVKKTRRTYSTLLHIEKGRLREKAQSYVISILLMGGAHRWNIATRSISGMVWLHFPPFRGGRGRDLFVIQSEYCQLPRMLVEGDEGISGLYLIYIIRQI
jgi:hypothetical protein